MAVASTQGEFAEVLKGALALSHDDQVRLCSVLQRVTGAAGHLGSTYRGAAPEPAMQSTVEDWLRQIQGESPWTQLVLLDEALEAEDSPAERCALEAARTQLLRTHTPVAIRRAVTDLASRSPVAICVGALGLLVGVVGIGRLLLRLLF